MNLQTFRIPISFQALKVILYIIVTLGFLFCLEDSIRYGNFSWKSAGNDIGYLVWILLIYTIFISLFVKLFPKIFLFRQLFTLRKQTGLVAFAFLFFHLVFQLFYFQVLGNIHEAVIFSLEDNWSLTIGTLSLILMIPLAITSTQWAMRKMGKYWVSLHKITHVVFVLAGLHIAFVKFLLQDGQLNWDALVILGLYGLGYGFLFWKKVFMHQEM